MTEITYPLLASAVLLVASMDPMRDSDPVTARIKVSLGQER